MKVFRIALEIRVTGNVRLLRRVIRRVGQDDVDRLWWETKEHFQCIAVDDNVVVVSPRGYILKRLSYRLERTPAAR